MKVLVCEDDAPLTAVITDMLEHANFTVVSGSTMVECKEVLQAHSDIEFVVMDGQMPMEQRTGIRSTDVLVEYILEHRPALTGRIFAFSGHPDHRDKILLVGASKVLGRRKEDDPGGVLKPTFGPILEHILHLSTRTE